MPLRDLLEKLLKDLEDGLFYGGEAGVWAYDLVPPLTAVTCEGTYTIYWTDKPVESGKFPADLMPRLRKLLPGWPVAPKGVPF